MTEILWNGKEVLGIINGHGSCNWFASGISIDTRTLNKGDIFFALPGLNNDGNDFIEDALNKGACAAISNRPSLVNSKKVIFVNDVYKALNKLANYARQRTKAKIIGITGSSGKTTLKEMISSCLVDYGKVHKSERSFNNHIGVPLSLARMPIDVDYAVFEIGMNNKGEILKLTNLIKPHIGIVNNVGEAHIGNFHSKKDLIEEKLSIIEGIADGGSLIINENLKSDLDINIIKNKSLNISTFGVLEDSDVYLKENIEIDNGSVLKVRIKDKIINYTLAISGEHMALNTLPALMTCKITNNPTEKFIKKLSNFKNIEGRGNTFNLNFLGKSLSIINESFNANPNSMEAAIISFNNLNSKSCLRKVLFIGDMMELGRFSENYNNKIAQLINNTSIDIVYAVGEEIRYLWEEIDFQKKGALFQNVDQVILNLQDLFDNNDVVMLKASSKINFSKVIKEINTQKPIRKIA